MASPTNSPQAPKAREQQQLKEMATCLPFALGMVKKSVVEQIGLGWIMLVIDYFQRWVGRMVIVLEGLGVWRHRKSLFNQHMDVS
jgi:hypothetical protein